MSRGDFSSLRDSNVYREAQKQWYVELIQSYMYWYDLMVNEPDGMDTRKYIPEMLKALKQQVEENLDKRFIYFIVSRKKIRFSRKKKPKYSLISGKLKIYLEVGKNSEPRCVQISPRDPNTGRPIKPRVETTERFITFFDANGNRQSFPIHDFFAACDVSLGFTSEIHYVGFTKNPHKRPIDGSHAGLSEVLYKLSDGDSDIFIYYNLFKITTQASGGRGMQFLVSNAMIDEVSADKEGALLEKCLIMYFGADIQKRNKPSEEGELKNSLISLAKDNKIEFVTVHFEMEDPNEYFCFGSSKISAKHKHVFSCQIYNNDLVMKEGSPTHDAVFGPYE